MVGICFTHFTECNCPPIYLCSTLQTANLRKSKQLRATFFDFSWFAILRNCCKYLFINNYPCFLESLIFCFQILGKNNSPIWENETPIYSDERAFCENKSPFYEGRNGVLIWAKRRFNFSFLGIGNRWRLVCRSFWTDRATRRSILLPRAAPQRAKRWKPSAKRPWTLSEANEWQIRQQSTQRVSNMNLPQPRFAPWCREKKSWKSYQKPSKYRLHGKISSKNKRNGR